MERMNKAGQQMTLGTIIAIVLGIAVLVFLIFGFSSGWTNLWDRVTQFGGSSNVDTVIQACALKCSSGEKEAFCTQKRTIKFEKEMQLDDSCNEAPVDSKVKSCSAPCKDLIDFGVKSCSSISC